MTTGEIIAELRSDINLTQADLGKLLNCSDSTISAHEKGKRMISPEDLKRYAVVFNVSTDYLLGLTNQRSSASLLTQIFANGVTYAAVCQKLESLSAKQRKALLVVLEDMCFSAQVTERANENK